MEGPKRFFKGALWGIALSIPLWLVPACAISNASRGYEICNSFGNESGCGDPVNITVN